MGNKELVNLIRQRLIDKFGVCPSSFIKMMGKIEDTTTFKTLEEIIDNNEDLEEVEDFILYIEAERRMKEQKDGDLISHSEILKKYGLTEEDLEEADPVLYREIQIELPEELVSFFNINAPEFHKMLEQLIAYQVVRAGDISFGKAAELLGLDKVTYITDLGRLGISYLDMRSEELEQDVENIKEYLKGDKV
jgi:predicted HTH domain antitoxin/predicted DNA-binding protein